MDASQPIKTFRGTFAEVLEHRGEIPLDSVVEIRVFPPSIVEDVSLADSLAALLQEAAQVEPGEPIRYADPRKQAIGKSIGSKFRRQGFSG